MLPQLTKDDVKSALPIHLKNAATDDLVDALNTIPVDEEVADHIRNNFVTYTTVLRDGRYRIEDYLNAVAFCTFRLMGYNNKESYQRTFPDRYQKLVAKGTSAKDISAYVTAYNKNQLVNKIMEQAMIPTWILNVDTFQSAINKQVELMHNARSEMVQMQAAKTILETLKRPESKDLNINLGVQEDKGVNELRDMMVSLAERQKSLIESGMGTKEIAHQSLYNKPEMKDVTPKEEP